MFDPNIRKSPVLNQSNNDNLIKTVHNKLEKFSKTSNLYGYLYVGKNGTLKEANVIKICWENIKVYFGMESKDRLDSNKIKEAARSFLETNIDNFTRKDIPKIQKFAEKVGITPNQTKNLLERIKIVGDKQLKPEVKNPLTLVVKRLPKDDVASPKVNVANAEISPNQSANPESVAEAKSRLVGFYISQQIRLKTLKEQLQSAPASQKIRIESEILRIEHSNIARAQIAAKIRLGKEPSIAELASYLGKSEVALQGIILGQTYAKVILEMLPEIAEQQKISSDEALKKISQFNTEKPLGELNIDENLVKKIESRVATLMGITPEEISQIVLDLENETQLKMDVARLGEERVKNYPPKYEAATTKIFEEHKVRTSQQGMWNFFDRGNIPQDMGAELQYKLFLNPKAADFQLTLDRALLALSSMPYVQGKIVASDEIARKSEQKVINDPCEPKMLFYFTGKNGAQDFKKAIELLEKEFEDADLIGAPAGQRNVNGQMVEQWGPSFTNQRNRLMYYTQGGFTESGRDIAVNEGNLSEKFEGNNFYLHKGAKDPLDNLPSSTIQMDKFLDNLETYQSSFKEPLHLIKLENILNRLKNDSSRSDEVKVWVIRLENMIESTALNMGLERKQATQKLLENWENMQDVNSILDQAFYIERSGGKSLEEKIDNSKGVAKGKAEFIKAKAEEYITQLEELKIQYEKDPSKFKLEDLADLSSVSLIMDLTKEDLKNQVSEYLFKELKDKFNFSVGEKNRRKIKKEINNNLNISNDLRVSNKDIDDFFPEEIKFSLALPNLSQRIPIPKFKAKPDFDLVIGKLKNIKARQEERLDALSKGKIVIIPEYFHATDDVGAISIAKTGVESLQSTTGAGAFVSTQPEFRYGYVSLGLPKTIEFNSANETFLDQNSSNINPALFKNDQQFWVGLKKIININPYAQVLQKNFETSIRLAIMKNTADLSVSTEKKMEFEERLCDLLNRSVVFRADKDNIWTLNYRNFNYNMVPMGDVIRIENDQQMHDWIKNMINSAGEQSGVDPKSLSDSQAQAIVKDFKQSYYINKNPRDDYSQTGTLKNTLKASVIVPDDDLKEFFEGENLQKRRLKKGFKTMSALKKDFKNAGIGDDHVEFIPLSELRIERAILAETKIKVPKEWS